MKLPPAHPARLLLAALALAASGCAVDRLPRIDPSGDSILIFPSEEPAVAQPAPGYVTSTIPGSAATAIAPPPGNVEAPPALPGGTVASSDACPLCPFCPGCPLCPLGESPTVVGPVATGPVAEPPTDRVTLTPARVLAPVGSEVVLRAGVCGEDGYLRTNRKIEWMLGQNGSGEFVAVGEQGERDIMRFPWNTPEKVDNHYAVGYTAPFYTCLRRGTIDPRDDLQVKKGEAWISVTSASEGTSYVTAYAPSVSNWNARKANTTIYWVDAQWRLPPPAVVAAGQPHTLTTTVTRQSDGAPLEGWIVRYEVADQSGASLGYAAGQTAEATTGPRGQASVDVTPTDSQPGTARIRVVIVRPEQAGAAASPRLEVGSGEVSITWSTDAAGTQPLLPPVEAPPTQPSEPPPTTTEPPSQPAPPETPAAPPGRPELDIRMQRVTPDPIKVGDRVRYTITVRNVGDAAARDIIFIDEYDQGLYNEFDTVGNRRIEYPNMADLAPGESDAIDLEFEVRAAGELCHQVTVSAAGASDQFERDCFTATEDRPATPALDVAIDGPNSAAARETAYFNTSVTNTGDVAATNVRVRIELAPELAPDRAQPGVEIADDGSLNWTLDRLEPGQRREFDVQCLCQRATEVGRDATVRIFVQADAGVNIARETSVEIRPALERSPAEGAEAPAPGGATPLAVSIQADPARVGQRGTMYVTVANNGAAPLRDVEVRLNIPQQIAPQLGIATTPAGTQLRGEAPNFALNTPIAELRPDEPVRLIIPFDAAQQGRATVRAAARSADAAQWSTTTRVVDIDPP